MALIIIVLSYICIIYPANYLQAACNNALNHKNVAFVALGRYLFL